MGNLECRRIKAPPFYSKKSLTIYNERNKNMIHFLAKFEGFSHWKNPHPCPKHFAKLLHTLKADNRK